MQDQDRMIFDRAVRTANAGNKRAAYEQFRQLRYSYDDIELLFWIVATTPHPAEAEATLAQIAAREPYHPSLPAARGNHERNLQFLQPSPYAPAGPMMRCPYCETRAPAVLKSKVSTGGWVFFVVLLIVFFPLCWIGFLIREDYRACSYCGARLG